MNRGGHERGDRDFKTRQAGVCGPVWRVTGSSGTRWGLGLRAPTARAAQRGARGSHSRRGRRAAQQHVQQGDQALAVRMQENEVTRPTKVLGPHRLQYEPEEIGAGEGATFQPAGVGLALTKADLPVGASEDIRLANDAAVQIAPQIHQRLLAAAHRLTIDDPGARVAGRQRARRGLQAGQPLRPKHLRPCRVEKQIRLSVIAVMEPRMTGVMEPV